MGILIGETARTGPVTGSRGRLWRMSVLGDVFWDAILGGLVINGVLGLLAFRFRHRIMIRVINTFFEALPEKYTADFVERALGAYVKVEEIDLGKGKLGKQYVLTERSKALIAVVAPYLIAEGVKQFNKFREKAKEEGKGGGLGDIIGMFTGGKGGGLGDIIGSIFGGNKGGGQSPPSGGGGAGPI